MSAKLLIDNDKPRADANDMWLRRQALQIAAQLPEDRQQAIRVLAYARELVDFTTKRERGDEVALSAVPGESIPHG